MIKKLTNIIGQSEVVGALNEVINARNFAESKKKKFSFPHFLLSGLTGLGKTFLAEKYAKCFEKAGFQFFEIPVAAGWRFFAELALKASSIDDKTGAGSAMPTIFLVDEAHQKSVISEILKQITGCDYPKMFERNGVKFFHDPAQHQWLFASNMEIDPAQKRRLIEVPFSLYEKNEVRELIRAMCEKNVPNQSLDYLAQRVKPQAGHVWNMCRRLNLQPTETITLDVAKDIVRKMGLFFQGLERKDLQLMMRMGNDTHPTPIDALKAKIGDVKVVATRNRLGWLMAMEYVEVKRGGYTLTKKGETYLKDLEELQNKKKAKACGIG